MKENRWGVLLLSKYKFKSQRNFSLRKQVSRDIRDAIIQGNLKPGDKLREIEISTQMGVSRGPIREAFRELESQGLVLSLPYRETVVADVTKDEVINLLIPIRLKLELYVIEKKINDFDHDLFKELQKIIEDMEKYTSQNDIYNLIEEDIKFHETLISFDDLPYLKHIWDGIVNRIRLHFIKNTKMYNDLGKVVTDHTILLETLKKGDFQLIKKEWEIHMNNDDSLLCFSE
jgi:DNA-binding GntR family transcriptional regulator